MRNLLPLLILCLAVNACSSLSPTTISIEPTITQNSNPVQPTNTSTPFVTATFERTPNFSEIFINALPAVVNSCESEIPWGSISVYVYDLSSDQELVSIDADTPYLFASAFKGPALIYFLDNCKQYWDVSSPDWYEYGQDRTENNIDEWYSSDEYMQLLGENLSDVTNFNSIVSFSQSIRDNQLGFAGDLDKRFYILESVYQMVAQSDNVSSGDVLNFVYDNCLGERAPDSDQPVCRENNAISAFNVRFNDFSGIEYSPNGIQRGLYSWDLITRIDEGNQMVVEQMPTFGIEDKCASQDAAIECAEDIWEKNTWTARDLFKFYRALFQIDDQSLWDAAETLLSIDEPGISRGYLKNMARKMDISVMSKNGNSGSAIADAGILVYGGKYYAISVLSYNAFNALGELFGSYDAFGNPDGYLKGLLQELIEGDLATR